MSLATDTTARQAGTFRVTRSRRNVAWTGLGALVVVVVLALFPYLVGAAALSVLAHLEERVARGAVATEGPPSLAGIYRLA